MDTVFNNDKLQEMSTKPMQSIVSENTVIITFKQRLAKQAVSKLLADLQLTDLVDTFALGARLPSTAAPNPKPTSHARRPLEPPVREAPQLTTAPNTVHPILARKHFLVRYEPIEYKTLIENIQAAFPNEFTAFECCEWNKTAGKQNWSETQRVLFVDLSYNDSRAVRERIGKAFARKNGAIHYNNTTIPAGAISYVFFMLPVIDDRLPEKLQEQFEFVESELKMWLAYDHQTSAEAYHPDIVKLRNEEKAAEAALRAKWVAIGTALSEKVRPHIDEHLCKLRQADQEAAAEQLYAFAFDISRPSALGPWADRMLTELQRLQLSKARQDRWLANVADKYVNACLAKFPVRSFNLTEALNDEDESESDDDYDDDSAEDSGSYASKRARKV